VADAKYKDQMNHAKRRARERLGLYLNDQEILDIVKNIQNNKYQHIDKQSDRLSRFRADIRGQDVVVVYDKTRKAIITFLHYKVDPILVQLLGYKSFG
jgi:hypothetical protein